MAINRDDLIEELYMGINVIISKRYTLVPFDEFKRRMQALTNEDLRKTVLNLRKVLKKD